MKCSSVQSFFDRMYREGDAFDRADVTAHVRQCTRCGSDYKVWCGIAGKLGDEPALDAPPALFGKVLRQLDAQHARARRGWWVSLQGRLLLPYGPAFAAVVLVAAGALFIARSPMTSHHQVAAPLQEDGSLAAEVMVHFEISLADARQVALVGDFNGWNVEEHLLARSNGATWKIDLPIRKGSYQYLFLVDGTEWKTDPGRTQRIPDGFGGFNTVIEL